MISTFLSVYFSILLPDILQPGSSVMAYSMNSRSRKGTLPANRR